MCHEDESAINKIKQRKSADVFPVVVSTDIPPIFGVLERGKTEPVVSTPNHASTTGQLFKLSHCAELPHQSQFELQPRRSSHVSTSYKSASLADSYHVLTTKEDSYWVQKVDQLMQDKRYVIKLIKQKNS